MMDAYEVPVTRLPRRPVPPTTLSVFKGGPLPPGPMPKPSLNVDQVIDWIASCDDADRPLSLWNDVKSRLAELGARPNKFAVSVLPTGVLSQNFNGAAFARWLSTTTVDDVPTLQKLHAAMRLRWRHAGWLKKRRG